MEKNSNRNKILYIVMFFGINIINGFMCTTSIFNNGLSPYDRDLFMLFNSIFGDLGFLGIFFGLAILLFKSDKSRFSFLMIITILLSIVVFAMSVYLSNYGMFFSFYNLRLFGLDSGGESMDFVLSSILLVLKGGKIIFLLPIIILIILYAINFPYKKKSAKTKEYSFLQGINRLYFGFATIIVGLLVMMNSLTAYQHQIEETWFEDNSTPLYGTQAVGFFNYYVFDAYAYFTDSIVNVDEIKAEETKEKLKTYENECRLNELDNQVYCNSKENTGLFEDKNLLLIQLESLNNFVIGLKIKVGDEYVELTPNLNKLIEKSVYFNNFYTTVGIGNTSDAEFSAITGLYPTGPAYTIFEFNEVEYQSLAELFNNQNYSTFSIHANTGNYYERNKVHTNLYQFNKHYGSEALDELGVNNPDRFIHYWLNDADMLTTSVDLIKQENEKGNNAFAFAITITNHMPYDNIESLYMDNDSIFPEGYDDISSSFLGYLNHVHYTDYAIGVALQQLEEKGILDNTVVAMYGDHGSNIPIHNMFLDNPEIFINDVNGVYGVDYAKEDEDQKLASRRFMQNIPFIIYDGSNSLEPQIISKVRGTTDVSRTLINLFNLGPKYYFGVDALSNAPSYIYNPRSQDIITDDLMISSTSLEQFILNDHVEYTDEELKKYINIYRVYKDFNDKLLKYKLFPPLNFEEDKTAINN